MSEATETSASSSAGGSKKERQAGARVASLPKRIVKFMREVVAELRRVVWPTKQQVTTYTGVVLTFVVIMALLIFVIDYAAGAGVMKIFGS